VPQLHNDALLKLINTQQQQRIAGMDDSLQQVQVIVSLANIACATY